MPLTMVLKLRLVNLRNDTQNLTSNTQQWLAGKQNIKTKGKNKFL